MMLIFYIFLNVLSFVVSGEESISYACINGNATITFKKYYDINSTAKYTRIADNVQPELVATLLKKRISYYGDYNGKILVDGDGNLQIQHVSEKYAGKYKLEIRNGGTFKEFATLKVLAPPSGPPEIKQKVDERGHVVVSCYKPKDLGKPAAAVVLKDSLGNTQSQSEYTVNDNEYQCCLEGKSVNICYAKHLPRCQKINITEDKRPLNSKEYRDIHLIKECKNPGLCVFIGLCSYGVSGSVLLIYICISSRSGVYNADETRIAKCFGDVWASWKLKLSDNGLRRMKASMILSVVFLTLACGYFCSKEDCDNVFFMLLVGVTCFFCGVLPSLGSIFNDIVVVRQHQELNEQDNEDIVVVGQHQELNDEDNEALNIHADTD